MFDYDRLVKLTLHCLSKYIEREGERYLGCVKSYLGGFIKMSLYFKPDLI